MDLHSSNPCCLNKLYLIWISGGLSERVPFLTNNPFQVQSEIRQVFIICLSLPFLKLQSQHKYFNIDTIMPLRKVALIEIV